MATALAIAACGGSSLPDPKAHQSGQHVTMMIRMDPSITSSPAFRSASQACGRIPPGPGLQAPSAAHTQKQKQARPTFAQWMREHGFRSFPNPATQGEYSPQMVSAGINLNQPALLDTGLACIPATHGLLTAADIQRVINENDG